MSDHPTMGDYAFSAAQDAKQKAQSLETRVTELERAFDALQAYVGLMQQRLVAMTATRARLNRSKRKA